MTEEERLRGRLRAVAAASNRYAAELQLTNPRRPLSQGRGWCEELSRGLPPGGDDPFLVRSPDGTVHVIEDGLRRGIRSGLLVEALETQLGERRAVTADEFGRWSEGVPVEVFEGPTGRPFIVIGGHRLPLRGLPLPTAVSADEMLALPEGNGLNIGPTRRHRRSKRVPTAVGPLPTFLIIGAQKSGTRWLRSNLDLHPDIYAGTNELSFFNNDQRFHEDGLDWYRSQFRGWADEPVVGESTPGYMIWRHEPELVARRISDVLPDARLIAILRNPIDRALSAALHHRVRGRLPDSATLMGLVRTEPSEVEQLSLISGGWYGASLEPFVDLFGEQLLVLRHDDIGTDARGVYAKALRHVGASPDFAPAGIGDVRFSNRGHQSKGAPGPSQDERVELWEFFRNDVARLEELTGLELSAWNPDGTQPSPY